MEGHGSEVGGHRAVRAVLIAFQVECPATRPADVLEGAFAHQGPVGVLPEVVADPSHAMPAITGRDVLDELGSGLLA